MKKLQNKLALVTGSSRGIGQQIALGLAREGCNVILHGRSLQASEQTASLLKTTGVKAFSVAADLASVEQTNSMIRQIVNQHGGVDILYNNAAIGSPSKPIFEHTPEHWMQLFQVNLVSMFMLCAAFIPIMKKRGWGRVVNVSSGIKDQPNFAPYSASKAAVDKFTQDLSVDLKGTGVLANFLDPGWLRTDMGGPSATNPVEAVLPGALAPALLDDNGPNGKHFYALS